ncbi:unnamed protein product [Ilex paraguariensis]|uniref:WAT1-related protein n=1 Tax=Ilex paraguariensis TaxID=185542 RepID=A0ABC8RW03_9AQUA
MRNSWIIAILVATECADVGLNTLAKAATNQGMSEFVFVVYSYATALLFLLPSTFVFHRVRPCPPLTFSIVCRIFVLGLLSSPTLASVITDLTPAFTFILAIITRMEKLELKVPSSQAKLIGTIISITGAVIVTLYKGPSILFSQSASKLVYEPFLMPQWNWIFGGILCAVGIFFLALLFIVKVDNS